MLRILLSQDDDSRKELLLVRPQTTTIRNYCRLCLYPLGNDSFKELFSPFDSYRSIVEVVENFAYVKISSDDQFSKIICKGCFDQLNAADKFKYLIEQTNSKLHGHAVVPRDPLAIDKSNNSAETVSETIFDEIEIGETCLINGIEEINDFDDNNKNNIMEDIVESVTLKIESPEVIDCPAMSNEVEIVGEELPMKKPKPKPNPKLKEPRLKHKCGECNKKFISLNTLNDHILLHKSGHPFTCKVCNQGFEVKTLLELHATVHKPPKVQCESCGATFTRKRYLKRHQLVIHETKNMFHCKECGESFRSYYSLSIHKNQEHDCTSFKCKFCGKIFSTYGRKAYHMQVDHNRGGNRYVACTLCGKEVINLPMHMKFHTKRYQCHICAQQCGTQTLLNSHLTKHTDNKPYLCNLCGKTFKYASALYIHNKFHSDLKAFPCEVCDKRFKFKSHAQRHMRTIHHLTDV